MKVKMKIIPKDRKIYLHKEDVWANGDHGMSSASRDIFEYFYKAIKTTFMSRLEDEQILILMERIQNIRNWSRECILVISKGADDKVSDVKLPLFVDKRAPLPEEREFQGDLVLLVNDADYDKIKYSDFEDFFKRANHGLEDWKYCRKLYFNFMKEVDVSHLGEQLEIELFNARHWAEINLFYLKKFVETKSSLGYHRFLLNNVEAAD